jgi:hypothetical protein
MMPAMSAPTKEHLADSDPEEIKMPTLLPDMK